MASLNKVFLIGNLTRDPELRYTPSGKAVADIGMAVNRRYRNASGEFEEDTCFVNVTVWDKAAETCAEYLRKGAPLLVEGRLKYDQWEREGQKHSKLTIVAERTQFLGSPRDAAFRDAPADESARPKTARPDEATQHDDQAAGSAEPATDGQDGPTAPAGGDLAADEDNLPF